MKKIYLYLILILHLIIFSCSKEEIYEDGTGLKLPGESNDFRDALIGTYVVTCSFSATNWGTTDVYIQKGMDGKLIIRSLYKYSHDMEYDSYDGTFFLNINQDKSFSIPPQSSYNYTYYGNGKFIGNKIEYTYSFSSFGTQNCDCRGTKK